MPTASNNTKTLSLNEFNTAVLEGYNAAKDGQELNEVLSPLYSPNRQRGIREGYKKFRFESLKDSMLKYSENPSTDTFKSIVDAIGPKHPCFLKALALLGPFRAPVQDSTENLESLFNKLLAEELNAWYQYYITAPFLIGQDRPDLQQKFKEFADDELNDHATALLNRIHDLFLKPTWLSTPSSWSNMAYYSPVPSSVPAAIQTMIDSENSAIESYTLAINVALQCNDHVSADLFKHNLADEQEHLAALLHFFQDNPPEIPAAPESEGDQVPSGLTA